ncbi:hypothetical protein SKAU_G00116770 [Synaphobranchus kaupii]|uniref:SNTX thioredoxin-like domain-containing protein n=1 Tax=Synaphobranchus kaupii TaxID=118154 RepID=A0A9Q1FMR4_SYNKA|nr:hypothetical protein SKAU_G00116770 [Synaphobranchus kaupii]
MSSIFTTEADISGLVFVLPSLAKEIMDSQSIEIAALGRPLHLGMLYDCLKDTFIPGISLWDQAAIQKDMNVQPQPHTYLEVSASDSFSEKTKLMDVRASLKASFLAGLVEVGGSGSYLKDKISSMKQCRVTMQYKQTTEYKQLTMTQLGKVMYPEVFDQKIATHVVTAVLYGAEAFMVFDQMALNEKDKQDIKGNMDVMIKKIPFVEISGSGKVVLTDEEKKKVEKFSCTFYGDYALEQNPTSYEEAVLLYKQLPKLLGEDKRKAVPVRVWLYPLKNLDSRAAQLVREIGVKLVSHAEAIMDQLQEAKMRANDSIRRCAAIKVPDITDKLAKFQDKLASYTVILLQNIRKVLPAIRAGTEGEQTLDNILKFHDDSSFTHDKMKKWLDEKESEIGVLENYINSLGSVPIVPPGPELDKFLFDPQYHNVTMFTFTSLKYEEPYLLNLHECLASEEFNKMQEIYLHALNNNHRLTTAAATAASNAGILSRRRYIHRGPGHNRHRTLHYPKGTNIPSLWTNSRPHVNTTHRTSNLSNLRSPPPAPLSITFALLNTRSLTNKSPVISELILDNNIDFLLLTETWQQPSDYYALNQATPTNYCYIAKPRSSGRGGGIAVLHKQSLSVTELDLNLPPMSTFEYLALSLPNSITAILLYRPPKTHPSFLSELLTIASSLSNRLLLTGDFNIHVDLPNSPLTPDFLSLLDCFHLTQHINFPTHAKGHTLDLVCSSSLPLSNLRPLPFPLSDHHCILFSAPLPSPHHSTKRSISFRNIKFVNPLTLSQLISSALPPDSAPPLFT